MYAKCFRKLCSRPVLGSNSMAVSHLVLQKVKSKSSTHPTLYSHPVIFF